MKNDLKIGDKAILAVIPEWLTHDLPQEDANHILARKGMQCVVEDIDKYGYIWPGFSQNGSTIADWPERYTRAWFCVTSDCLQPVPAEGTG